VHLEVDVAGLQRTGPRLALVGHDVDAVAGGTLPAVGTAAGAAGHPELTTAIAALLDGVHVAVQGAVVCLTELSNAVEAAARDYAAQDSAVATTLRPGLQP